MTRHGRLFTLVLWTALVQLVLVGEAQAYIDPGAGSFVFQTVIAILVGAAVTLKMYWRGIKDYFGRGRSAAESDESGDSEPRESS